ncbi:site-specific integrase [Enterobacter kobei]|nr:site-specific integrase [Enterobacter kobei]
MDNKLSDKFLKALLGRPRDKQTTISDGRGLSARVSKTGGISFVYFFRIAGRDSAPIWMTIGRYPDMSLKTAREKRDQCRTWLSEGKDPRVYFRLKNEEALRPVTVKDAVDYWYENYAKKNRKRHEWIYKKYLNHIFPFIGKYPLSEVDIPLWLSCFDRIRKYGETQSAAMLTELKQILKYCRVRQMTVCRTLDDLSISDVGKNAKKSTRVICDEYLKDIWSEYFHNRGEGQHRLASQYRKRMFVLCMVLGCRMSEARLSTIDEWDMEKWQWIVPPEHSKNGVEIIRPIPEGLRQWVANVYEDNKRKKYFLGKLVHAGQVSGDGCKVHRIFKHKERWSLHDFRRTLSTNLNEMGVDYQVVESLLGHSIPGVAGIYNRSKYLTQKLEALNLWFSYLENLVDSESSVTFIKRAV